MRFAFRLVLLTALALAARSAPGAVGQLRVYETKYYVLHTDLPEPQAREAAMRLTKMAEVYHRRTADFSGAIRQKLPVYVFHHLKDYYDAGGRPDSGGLFDGTELMIAAPEGVNARVWHVLQHEGFHQFSAAVIRGDRPMWLNEGLAEYFGEAIFTGDDYVTGIIPQWRLERVREELKQKQFLPMDRMMQLSPEQWNGNELSMANYDQAWSIVHFLIHGDDGKYRAAFGRFIASIGQNHPWRTAWQQQFANVDWRTSNVEAPGRASSIRPSTFAARHSQWWLSQPDHPTADLEARAAVATFTSFLARAATLGQTFDSLDQFLATADHEQLQVPPGEQWLPISLMRQASAQMGQLTRLGYHFSLHLQPGKRLASIQATLPTGGRIAGSYAIQNGTIRSITVTGPDDVAAHRQQKAR